MQLPQNLTPKEFIETYRGKFEKWRGAIEELCLEHSVAPESIAPFTDGSNLIVSVDDRYVVKIFPPFHRHQWESEWRVLDRLWSNGLSIPIPKLIAHGQRSDHWTYVILSKLPGVTLENIWPSLDGSQKISLMKEIGAIMAQVHSVPIAELSTLAPEWKTFLQNQIERCHARHLRLGMPEWFLSEVNQFVEQRTVLLPNEAPVILTGEYTPFNLLVGQADGKWRISGMIDFGDAMIGFREYDFLGPSLFLAGGDPNLINNLFGSYNYPSPCVDKALRNRLVLLAVLHRYSDLKLQIRIEGWETRVQSFAELEQLIFPQ